MVKRQKAQSNTENRKRKTDTGPHSLLARPTKSSGRAQGGIGGEQFGFQWKSWAPAAFLQKASCGGVPAQQDGG